MPKTSQIQGALRFACPHGKIPAMVVVAQLVRASVCGTEGRGFKSLRLPHFLHEFSPIFSQTPAFAN